MLAVLMHEYPQHSVEQLLQIAEQAGRVTSAMSVWSADAIDYTLPLARDFIDAGRCG